MAVICLSPDHPVFHACSRETSDAADRSESRAADSSNLLLLTVFVREIDPRVALAKVIYNTMTAVDVAPLSVRDALGLLAGGDDNLSALLQALDGSLPIADVACSLDVAPGTIARRAQRAVELQSRIADSATRLHDWLDQGTVSFQKLIPSVLRNLESIRLERPNTAARVEKRCEELLIALADVQLGLVHRIGCAKFEACFKVLLSEMEKLSPGALPGIDFKPIRSLLTKISKTLQQFHRDLGRLRELLPQLCVRRRLLSKTHDHVDLGVEYFQLPATPFLKEDLFSLIVARA